LYFQLKWWLVYVDPLSKENRRGVKVYVDPLSKENRRGVKVYVDPLSKENRRGVKERSSLYFQLKRLPLYGEYIYIHFLIGVFSSTAIQILSPAAPSAALTAPRRPHLSTAGAPVAATRVAAHWRSSPLVGAPPLWLRRSSPCLVYVDLLSKENGRGVKEMSSLYFQLVDPIQENRIGVKKRSSLYFKLKGWLVCVYPLSKENRRDVKERSSLYFKLKGWLACVYPLSKENRRGVKERTCLYFHFKGTVA
jgi:hypothetical protein